MNETIGAEFQRETKYDRDLMAKKAAGPKMVPDTRKVFPGVPRFDLPPVEQPPTASLHDLLVRRRSVRHYRPRQLSLEGLSYLLWASNGIRVVEDAHGFRTAPSAGALYPIETYIVANTVDDIPQGLYHYSASEHALRQLRQADLGVTIANAALGQGMCAEAAVVFVWTAVFDRATWRYGQRAYRYVYLDAGHIAQNLALAAVALDLGTCQIGALFDDDVNEVVGIDDESESVVYMSTVGFPAL